MGITELCPCFKQHYPIQVNPLKNYPKLDQIDEPEPEPEPESEPPKQIPFPIPGPNNPQNSHPPVNIVNHEAQNVEVVPHDNQVMNQAMEPPHEEGELMDQNLGQRENREKKNEQDQKPKQDDSQKVMNSSNNPNTDTKFGTNNKNEEEEEGLSFLDEDGDSLFSSGFDDSFELENKPVQNAEPSKFRFS